MSSKDLHSLTLNYGAISKFLHWLMAFLLFFMIGLGLSLDLIPGAYKLISIKLHQLVGIILLFLFLFRVFWSSTHSLALNAQEKKVLQVASRIVHSLLYFFLLAMPLSGILMCEALGREIYLWAYKVPAFIEPNRNLGINLKYFHAYASYSIMALIVLHIGAAFYHHLILKDNVMKRMLPKFIFK